ncbi:MAG: hypothetical protein BV456_11570, partial [Thermoplasmata archaeon M8B2D]
MKKIWIFPLFSLVFIFSLIHFSGAAYSPTVTYCIEQGGNYTYNSSGSFCNFPDGESCESWAFYRGDCTINNSGPVVNCYKAGEPVGISIGCCTGLESIPQQVLISGQCEQSFEISDGSWICSDCG